MKHKQASRWVLLFLLGFSIVALWAQWQPQTVATSTTATASQTLEVVVDAGHGGFDGGATVDGIVEKDINLAISNQLADLLTICGATVYQTRTTDTALSSSDSTGSAAKTEDIFARLALFSEYPEALVVSVHQNYYEESQYSGAQMFYGVLNEESVAFASALQERFYDLQPDNTREIKEGPTSVYLLQYTENPMVLAECGFLSNPEEADLLTQPTYQNQVAFTLFCGIADYAAASMTNTSEEQDDESEN